MKKAPQTFIFPLFILLVGCRVVSPVSYSPANAHSHNDYLNPVPFYFAYRSGFGSIEADIFPVKDSLFVAHKKEEIQPQKTLQELYFKPVLAALKADSTGQLRLLIDIKEDYLVALPILIRQLEPLKPWLTGIKKPNRLTILISGKRPPPAEYKNYPSYIFFDDDLKLPHSAEEWNRVGLVSLPFNKITAWSGTGSLARKDRQLLRHKVDSVHGAGKLIRFWAAPDTDLAWKEQKKLRVDLIGTDKIEELGNLLQTKNKY